jgi:hypothetical protein
MPGVDTEWLRKVGSASTPRASGKAQAQLLGLPRVSAESVALIPQCAECGKVWLPVGDERWEACLTHTTSRRDLAALLPGLP